MMDTDNPSAGPGSLPQVRPPYDVAVSIALARARAEVAAEYGHDDEARMWTEVATAVEEGTA